MILEQLKQHTFKFYQTFGPLFTKRQDVLPKNVVKYRSREIGFYNDHIVLHFDRHLGSAAASQISERL